RPGRSRGADDHVGPERTGAVDEINTSRCARSGSCGRRAFTRNASRQIATVIVLWNWLPITGRDARATITGKDARATITGKDARATGRACAAELGDESPADAAAAVGEERGNVIRTECLPLILR